MECLRQKWIKDWQIMALSLKNLASGQLGTTEAKLYGYTSTPPTRSALVKNIILTNTNTTTAYTASIRLKPANGTPLYQISPVDISIPAKGQVVLDTEVTMDLSALDQIWGKASNASTIDYIINGLERDI
jgi:hypothetical protein